MKDFLRTLGLLLLVGLMGVPFFLPRSREDSPAPLLIMFPDTVSTPPAVLSDSTETESSCFAVCHDHLEDQ